MNVISQQSNMGRELVEERKKAYEINRIMSMQYEMNDVECNYKTQLLEDIDIDIQLLDSINNNDNKQLCLVFSLFGHKSYLKMLYFAILSRIIYTDINDFNIKIFVQNEGYERASILLSHIIGQENIIKMPDGLCYKHHAINHPVLKDYEVIVIEDVDSFVVSNKFNDKMYRDLYEYHIQNKEEGLFAFRGDVAKVPMENAFTHLNPYKLSKENYYNLFNFSEEFLNNEKWYHSCHFSFHQNTFNKTQLDKYRWSTFVYDVSFYEMGCDESVFISALTKMKKKLGVIDYYLEHHKVVDSLDKLDDYKLVHPLIGEWCGRKKNKLFFTFLLDKAKEYKN